MESEESEHVEISLGGINTEAIDAEVDAAFKDTLNEMATWEESLGLEPYVDDPGWLYEDIELPEGEEIPQYEYEEIQVEVGEEIELKIDVGMDELDLDTEGYETVELELLEMDEGGVVLGEYIPEVVTKKEIAAAKAAGEDIVLEKEIEDAIFRGMWVMMGLMDREIVEWTDTLYGEGEMTPTEEAVDFGLITQEQADKQAKPFFTVDEIIGIIEGGPVIQMFETSWLVAHGSEELILGNFLMTVGRPDLLDHIIMMEDEDYHALTVAIGESACGGGAVTNKDPEETIPGIGGIGGIMQERLDADKDENEGERSGEERIGEEEEQEKRGCIGGIIDERTCAGCMSAIGTCGLMSELAKPPFHENCRCEIYEQ